MTPKSLWRTYLNIQNLLGGYSKMFPLVIRGGNGTGEPVFDLNKGIWLNGDGDNDLDHETFYFDPNVDTDFEFCKTSRKPYDFVVCCLLLSLKKRLNNFSYTSDGNKDDWKPAKDFFKKHIKKHIKK
jgi:hypothetical protein